MKVLNFGSLNIDYVYGVEHFVRKGETISSDSLHTFSGGKGLNQSVALARAGEEVYHAGVIGKDGLFLLDVLNSAGVDTSHVFISDEVGTGHAVIQNDQAGDNCIILFGGANQSVKKDQVDQVLSDFEPGDFIVLQNEINELGYLIEQAHKKGMVIAFNPSPMNSGVLKLPLDMVDYFLLNEVEAAALGDGAAGDEEAVLLDLAKKFPKAKIVLTIGEKGSLFWDGAHVCRQEAVRVEAVDTTAAGDTYTGYFIAGEIRKKRVEETMFQAAVASAITVTRQGAAPSIPALDEVEKQIRQLKQ